MKLTNTQEKGTVYHEATVQDEQGNVVLTCKNSTCDWAEDNARTQLRLLGCLGTFTLIVRRHKISQLPTKNGEQHTVKIERCANIVLDPQKTVAQPDPLSPEWDKLAEKEWMRDELGMEG